ncbi:glutathione S-transferase [Pseudomonas fluorescens group sp. PF-1]|jgi:glutathione S-transferase|uniref:glutathione S-transferase n=1 Tax=Pseudomonas sp. DP16D-R1 TaxID=2075551 RepID=UPI000CD0E4CA|nr:glutathione S-transferase [Pseudomonas sp. DP16D-R1]POA77639.1 glutathione S-transferase [Pseudomonas sp. DP16D-R1]
MTAKLVIGDFKKSSWSLRAWLVMVTADAAFDTVQIKLEQPDTQRRISEYSPSGKVPALLLDSVVINDSLAISEYIAEAYPDANLWPRDTRLRALARSAAAEMHSGFTHLRTQMAFGLGAGDDAGALTAETKEEIDRIFSIWEGLLAASQSSAFLCGPFGIVDAMFAPVVFRFRRYGISVPPALQKYVDLVVAYGPVQQWLKKAAEEV